MRPPGKSDKHVMRGYLEANMSQLKMFMNWMEQMNWFAGRPMASAVMR